MDASERAHPSLATLRSFGSGQLDALLADAVAQHLASCPPCRDRMAALSPEVSGEGSGLGGSSPAAPSSIGSSLTGLHGTLSNSPRNPALRTEEVPAELLAHPDYEVIRELGRGGMGVVYLAENRLMGRKEVLKVVAAEMLDRKGVLERFLREIRLAAMLQHRNIVAAYSASRVGPHLVLAMEYVEGYDLGKLHRANTPISVAHACHFICQAASGLQHAHERGLVHRDIKPSNLMLSTQGGKALVKIMDFGLAKANSEGMIQGGLTHSGQMLGTPYYMAPEQSLDAQKADIRADIYSLGCTLYYLLSGGPPFDGGSLYEILDAHQRLEPSRLDEIRADVPWEVAQIVARMMAKSPADRYQTPAEVAKALTPFTRKESQAAGSAPGRPRPVRHAANGTLIESESPPQESRRDGPELVLTVDPAASSLQVAAPSQTGPWSGRLSLLLLAGCGAFILLGGLVGAWVARRAPSPSEPLHREPPRQAATTTAPRPAAPTRSAASGPAPGPEVAPRPVNTASVGTSTDGRAPAPPSRGDVEPLPSEGRNTRRPPAEPKALADEDGAGAHREDEGGRSPRDRIAGHTELADTTRPSRTGPREAEARRPDLPPAPTAESVPHSSVMRMTLDDLLTGRVDASRPRRVRLDDVFFIGTRVDRTKGIDGARSFLHVSQKDKGVLKAVCINDGRIEKHPGRLLLVDEIVAGSMGQLSSNFYFESTPKPTYYAELEVMPEGKNLVITAMEVLLVNTQQIAQGRYRGAFLVHHIDQGGVEMVRNVDDEYWFRKLGGQGFINEWRNKYNKLAIRQRNNEAAAVNDRLFAQGMNAAARAKAAGDAQMQAFARSKGF